jgi:hypothetical protein
MNNDFMHVALMSEQFLLKGRDVEMAIYVYDIF